MFAFERTFLSLARLERRRTTCEAPRSVRFETDENRRRDRRRVENINVFAASRRAGNPPPEPFQKVREPQDDGFGVSLRERPYRQHHGILHRPERPDSGPHPGGSQFPRSTSRTGAIEDLLVDPHSSNAADSATPRQEYRAIAHCLRRSIRRPTSPPTNPPALRPRSPRPDPPTPSFGVRREFSRDVSNQRVGAHHYHHLAG